MWVRIFIDYLINKRIEMLKKKYDIRLVEVSPDQILDREGKKFTNHVLVKILNEGLMEGMTEQHIRMLQDYFCQNYMKGYLQHPWSDDKKYYTKYHTTRKYCKHYLEQLIRVTKSIQKHGYIPEKKNGHIAGEMLMFKNEYSFVLYYGYRRTAALTYLGYKEFDFELFKGFDKRGGLKNAKTRIY